MGAINSNQQKNMSSTISLHRECLNMFIHLSNEQQRALAREYSKALADGEPFKLNVSLFAYRQKKGGKMRIRASIKKVK